MSADAGIPEFLTWDELQHLPGDIADEIELWDRRVIFNRRGPLGHQRFTVRMHDALEANADPAATPRPASPGTGSLRSILVRRGMSRRCGT